MSMTLARPVNLTEKYRPRLLSEILGQSYVIAHLMEYAAAPYPVGMIFEGPTGTGKTSAARALARELGCDPDDDFFGGYRVIAAGEQTADTVRNHIKDLWVRRPNGGWKILLVEEADRMSQAVDYLWLTAMEELPPCVTVIFTTNYVGNFKDRLAHRMEVMSFTASGTVLQQEAEELIRRIWTEETGSMNDVPPLRDVLDDDEPSIISFRDVVQRLGPLIRDRKANRHRPAPPPALEDEDEEGEDAVDCGQLGPLDVDIDLVESVEECRAYIEELSQRQVQIGSLLLKMEEQLKLLKDRQRALGGKRRR